MSEPLPASLQPTAADIARDKELAAEAQAILQEVEASGGGRVKVNTESYNAVTFGPDGKPVSRVRNGVPQQTREQEAVARAQAALVEEHGRAMGLLPLRREGRHAFHAYATKLCRTCVKPKGAPKNWKCGCPRDPQTLTPLVGAVDGLEGLESGQRQHDLNDQQHMFLPVGDINKTASSKPA